MSNILEHIKELFIFYVDTNYNHYITTNKIEKLEGDDLKKYVEKLYDEKKEDSILFVKNALKKLLKDEYPGDSDVMKLINSQDVNDEDNIKNIYDGLYAKYN